MTHPGMAFFLFVGVGLGAFLYYMFADQNSNNDHQYGQEGGGYVPSDPPDPWTTHQDEKSRRRKRGSCSSAGKSSCTICLLDLTDKPYMQLFPCRHEFHNSCIAKWQEQGPVEARKTCPNCRETIISVDIKSNSSQGR